jgi:hypothetical protein
MTRIASSLIAITTAVLARKSAATVSALLATAIGSSTTKAGKFGGS